jgi:hypothetical protein
MPVSKHVSPQNLQPGKPYIIDVQWNLTNNFRMPVGYITRGTFVKNTYVRGRTGSFDTGLQILLSRSRCETTFRVDGKEQVVSSVNRFYEVLTPRPDEFSTVSVIYKLPLPTVLKQIICQYAVHVLPICYKPRRKKRPLLHDRIL